MASSPLRLARFFTSSVDSDVPSSVSIKKTSPVARFLPFSKRDAPPPASSTTTAGALAGSRRDEDAAAAAASSSFWSPPSLNQVVGKLGFGGVLGLCTGYALKQAAKVVAVCLGGAIVFLQSLAYAGYIQVNWDKITKDAVAALDTDGSGELGLKDVRHYARFGMRVLTHQGPTAGGFALGIYTGFGM